MIFNSLQVYSPNASLTGAIFVENVPTISSSASFSLVARVLLGASSDASESKIILSIGMLNAFKAANCSSLFGYPIMMKPFISSSFPK